MSPIHVSPRVIVIGLEGCALPPRPLAAASSSSSSSQTARETRRFPELVPAPLPAERAALPASASPAQGRARGAR